MIESLQQDAAAAQITAQQTLVGLLVYYRLKLLCRDQQNGSQIPSEGKAEKCWFPYASYQLIPMR